MPDLITFGETMLRLSSPHGRRLEEVSELDVTVGGAESNVAAVAARFDHDVQWVSQLPNSPLGRRVTGELKKHGIEPAVNWTDGARLGTYYLEGGAKPRSTDVVYDRDNSAFTTVSVDDLHIDRLRESTVFHTSGITPGLSESSREATESLLQTASDAGVQVSFDLNYRAKIWGPSTARQCFEELLEHVDLLFAPERDISNVLGISGTASVQAKSLAGEYGLETVVVTQGDDGAHCRHEGSEFTQSVYETETIDAIGTGDAFVGGFLGRRLDGGSVDDALEFAAAAAALKRTIRGDMAVITRDEIRSVIEEAESDISR